ncbi:MAG TPA: response regulator [Polyangiaceae bacterium]
MVVDDEYACVVAIARLLGSKCDVLTATTFAEAEHMLETVSDLTAMILDVCLGDRSGLDLLAALRSSGGPLASLPVLVITGKTWERHANPAYDLGADFVEKPVNRERLERFVFKSAPWSVRLQRTVCEWGERHDLTASEEQVLLEAARGLSKEAIAADHGSCANTVKKHVTNLLRKTGDDSLQHAVSCVLRSALSAGQSD